MDTTVKMAPVVGIVALCAALGLSRATFYRHQRAAPLCQRHLRQSLLDISVLMGGEWSSERAETNPSPSSTSRSRGRQPAA